MKSQKTIRLIPKKSIREKCPHVACGASKAGTFPVDGNLSFEVQVTHVLIVE